MNEKKPEKLPFKMTEEEEKYYQRSLAQYEEMKKAHTKKQHLRRTGVLLSVYFLLRSAFSARSQSGLITRYRNILTTK